MRKALVWLIILLNLTALLVVWQPNSFVNAAQVTVEPLSSGDDVTAVLTYEYFDTTDYIYVGIGQEGETMKAAIRFPNVQVPQGATIISATLNLYADVANNLVMLIYGELTANATQITDNNDYLSRTRTTNYVVYNISTLLDNQWLQIDVTQIIQEIINQTGWTSGNALQIFLDFDNTTTTDYAQISSYDKYNSVDEIPYLTITYSIGEPDISLSADATSKNSPPYQSVQFTITLTNNGTATGNYSISASDTLGWTLSLNTTSITLDANQSALIGLTVDVPFAQAGTQDSITVTVTESNTGLQRSITLTVTENTYISFNIKGSYALSFREDGAVKVGRIPELENDAGFTVRAIVKITNKELTYRHIVGYYTDAYGEGSWFLRYTGYDSGGTPFYAIQFFVYDGTSPEPRVELKYIDENKTYDVIVRFDKTNGKLEMWVNNQLIATKSKTSVYYGSTRYGISIGARWTGTSPLAGDIMLIQIWNRTLTEAEIRQAFSDPDNPPLDGLVLWLAPDSVNPDTGIWQDKSGLGYNGNITGATPIPYTLGGAKPKGGMSFDGVDDYVRVINFESMCFDKVTVIAFVDVKYNSVSAFVAKANNISSAPYYEFFLGYPSGGHKKIGFYLGKNDGTYSGITTSAEYATFSGMVAGSYDGSVAKIYVNGTLDSSALIDIPIAQYNLPLLIGQYLSTYYMDGSVYRIMIYNRTLSDSEIQQIYKDPNNPPLDGLVLWLAPDSIDLLQGKWLDKSGNGNHGTIYGAEPVNLASLTALTVEVTSNVNFNVNVAGTDFSDGSGNVIPVGNFYADGDGAIPLDIQLDSLYQTLYSNQAYGENLSLPLYLFVLLPSPLPAGNYAGTIYVDVVQT